MTTTTENALLIPEIDQVAEAFKNPELMGDLIAKIEVSCRAEHLTAATREGRERIKSLAYKIARSKTAMDEVGKGLTEDARRIVEGVNALRKTAATRMDALKDEIRAPLTAWEKADDERKQRIKDRITALFGNRGLPNSSADLRAIQDATVQIELDDSWGEFLQEATKAKDNFLRNLAGKIQEAEREEAREAEIRAYREAEQKRQAVAAEEQRRREADEAEKAKAAEELAARDKEIADLKAALLAATQPPLPIEPVVTAAEVPAEVIAIGAEPVAELFHVTEGDNLTAPTAQDIDAMAEHEIRFAILGIIKQCSTKEAMAAEVASALMAGQIPHIIRFQRGF